MVRGRIRFWMLFPKKCFAQRNAIEKVAFEGVWEAGGPLVTVWLDKRVLCGLVWNVGKATH